MLCVVFMFDVYGQHTCPGNCGIDRATQKMIQTQHDLLQKLQESRKQIYEQEKKQIQDTSYKNGNGNCANPIGNGRTIPVVFHVIHQGGPEKINKAQIDDVIIDINEDFNACNDDRLEIGDPFFEDQACVGLQFALATKDPNGNATTGVTYTESYYTLDGANFETQMKALIHWPRETYLNVWVVNQTNGGGASGYAHYPEVVHNELDAYKDGIVMDYRYVGQIEAADPAVTGLSRRHILSHEIGHWLGLQHTWGDLGPNILSSFPDFGIGNNCNNDDYIGDTPGSIGYNGSASPEDFGSCIDLPNDCPEDMPGGIFPYDGAYTCMYTDENGNLVTENDVPTNIFNMMDYGLEVMFTHGQKARMNSYLNPPFLSDPISSRNLIGVFESYAFVPDGVNTLTMDGCYFQESPNNDGTIVNEITVELQTGSFIFTQDNGNSMSPNYYLVNNLPTNLHVNVLSVPGEPQKARLQIAGQAEEHDNINDVTELDNFDVVFRSGAFTPGTTTNLYRYNTITEKIPLTNLKIDFIEPKPVYTRFSEFDISSAVCVASDAVQGTDHDLTVCPIDKHDNEDYGEFYLEHAGYLAIQRFNNDFYLIIESGVDVQVLTTGTLNANGEYQASYQPENVAIDEFSPSLFKPLTRSPETGNPIKLPMTGLDINSDPQYIAFKINTQESTGSRTLYGWISVNGSEDGICVYESVYHTEGDEKALMTGENQSDCESYPQDVLVPYDWLTLGGVPVSNGMNLNSALYNVGFDVNNYYNQYVWAIWIDVDQDGFFGIDESFFFVNYIFAEDMPAFTGQTYVNLNGDTYTVPALDLTAIPSGQYNMRVIMTPYNYNYVGNFYSINPCAPYIDGITEDFVINIGTPSTFDVRVCLEGPYDDSGTDLMTADLTDVLPFEQPYNVAPYNYSGNESVVGPFDSNVVDWVLVEARTGTANISGASGTNIVGVKAALLLTNGQIVEAYDQSTPLTFYDLPNANAPYYLVIRHRNHLDIMTSTLVSPSSNNIINLTVSSNSVFGIEQTKEMLDGAGEGTGIYAMHAGDYNQDNTIQTTDYDKWFELPASVNTYNPSDGNLDATVQATDYDVWFPNKAKVGGGGELDYKVYP